MSLRDKYTPEEWDAKEKEISRKKKNNSLDMFSLLNPIQKTGTKFEETEEDKKEFSDLVINTIGYNEVLKFNKLEENLTKEFERRKGRDILDMITHKVYEYKFDNKCPNVAILSPNDYHDLGIISDFHLDYITVMGCKLKIHVSPNAEDGNIEIY